MNFFNNVNTNYVKIHQTGGIRPNQIHTMYDKLSIEKITSAKGLNV